MWKGREIKEDEEGEGKRRKGREKVKRRKGKEKIKREKMRKRGERGEPRQEGEEERKVKNWKGNKGKREKRK